MQALLSFVIITNIYGYIPLLTTAIYNMISTYPYRIN